MEKPEIQRRTCRVCGEGYDYPGHRSLATRFHCERCVSIPGDIQRVLEILRRRVDRLAKEVEALRK